MNSLYKKRVFLQPFKCCKNTRHAPGGTGSGKRPSQSNGKDVKSGSTGDAGITLYVGMGLVAAMACGALVMKRRRKED